MKCLNPIVWLLLTAPLVLGQFPSDGVVFCYWGAWANERSSLGRFGVSDLPTGLCTHIIYSFIGLTPEGNLTIPAESTIEGKDNSVAALMALKEQNSELKILVAIGGWTEGSENFSIVSNNDELRAALVSNIVTYMQTTGFDGLDVDWEYPAQRGGNETDKESFVWLLRDLKTALEPQGWLLTAAVAVTQYAIETSYDVPNMNQYLDYINLMTYDFYGSWDAVTGVNAPLYPQLTDDTSSTLNVAASLQNWLTAGATASKVVLGMAAYGRSYTLEDLTQTGTGAPSSGAGVAGPYTNEAGFMAYYEICLQQSENEWEVTQVDNSYVFGNFENLWIGYDNIYTIEEKGKFARQNNLAGIMYWAVDLDDFASYCHEEPYPLIRHGIEGYNNAMTDGAIGIGLSFSLALLYGVFMSM